MRVPWSFVIDALPKALSAFANATIGLTVCSLYGAGTGVLLYIPLTLCGVEPGMYWVYSIVCLPGMAASRFLLTSAW